MLKLTYTRATDQFKRVTVIGTPEGIRDLYWQLTFNYKAQDGTRIGTVKVTNLDGDDCTKTIMEYPYAKSTAMDSIRD